MDKIKGLMGKLGGNKGSGSGGQSSSSGGGQDYVDKGMEAAEKKFGVNVSKEQNEKISDAGRGFYEKQTGSKVPDKVSN